MQVLTGPDASHHQGSIDWRQVKAAGHSFAFCKLTDGTSYGWVTWGRANLLEVRAAGLIPGAYHWLAPGRDGAAQARYFVSELNKAGGIPGTVCALDVEKEPDGTFPTFDVVRAFVGEWRRLAGAHPLVVYTGRWFWASGGAYYRNPAGSWIGPLWHSEYEPSLAEVEDGPELDGYGGWPHATFWQFTSNDRGLGMDVPGIAGSCDLNRFFGDRAALVALTGATQPQEDDMPLDAADKKWLTDRRAEDRVWLAEQMGKQASVLATGHGNELANAALKGWGWLDEHPASLATLLAAVKGIDIDEATIAAAIGPTVAAAVVAALPPEVTDHVTVDEVEAAVIDGLGKVRLLPDAG